jgi:autotransporter-associated beta strand protein
VVEAALRLQRPAGRLAVVLSMMCLLMAPSAFADGGAGGTGNGNAGGSGGTGTSGSSGGAGTPVYGGGGGGGAGGGAGGAGLAAGGSGGTTASHNGQAGTTVLGTTPGLVTFGSGAGGGGGWNGNDTGTAGSGQATISNSGSLTGGNGGDGGNVFNLTSIATFGSGGGGGAGGYGAIVTGSAADSNSGTIKGGNGGVGGSGSGPGTQGGSGGDGGIGALFTGSSVIFTNSGTITGGNGGAQGVGGTSFGVGGLGGAGIVGSNLTIINSGSIAGGTSGFISGVSVSVRADAITFTGGANTLTLVGSGWSLTGNVAINGGGSLTFDQSTDQTLANTIIGNGSVIQNGLGTLTLTGANTYTAGTTVTSGLINFAAGNNLGTGTITLNGGGLQWAAGNQLDISSRVALGAAGATFDTNGNHVTFATGLTGTGGLTKTGSGTLTLASNNSYSGGTTISGGSLQLAGGSLPVTGAVTLAGGTLDLNGQFQTVGALSGTGAILLFGGQLTAGDATDTVLAAGITGGGSFVKQGTGTLTLTGISSVDTTVSAGRLAVNGSLTGNVTVGVGGNLGGGGSIVGAVVNNGTISPGNSIGTLAITGSYAQAAGSTYQVEVNSAGQSDRITVTGVPGTATLNGGTVQVIAAPGTYARTTTYTILSATGGVTGTFAGVTSNFAFLTPSLSYDTNDVFLLLIRSGFSVGALTPNQHAVGTALDNANATATGDFATVLNAISGLDTTQGPSALDAISGQPYADFGTVNTAMGYAFANAIGNQLSGQGGATRVALAEACDVACDATAPGRWGAWLSGIGGLGSVPGQGSNSGAFTYNFGGTAVGLDYRLDPRILVGASLGFATGSQWVNGFNGRGSVDAFSGSLYGSFTEGALYVNAVAGYSRASNRLTRVITIPGLLQRTAYGQTTADQFVGQLEAGYHFAVGPGFVTPFARLQGSTISQAGFSEWGADSLDLTVASQTTNSLRTTLGAELQDAFGPVDLHLRLGWLHEYADTARPMTASFAGAPGVAFTVFGATPQRDSAAIGFSGRAKVGEATELYARYDGEVGGGSDNHAFTAGLRMVW